MTRFTLTLFIFTLAACTSGPANCHEQLKSNALTNSSVPVDILESIHDKKINLTGSDYKLTALLFFDLDCQHCREAVRSIETTLIPAMDKARYRVVGVGRGHGKNYLLNWSDTNNIAMQLVADDNKSIYKQFADRGVPHIFIIDQQGVIRLVNVGWSAKTLAKLHKALDIN